MARMRAYAGSSLAVGVEIREVLEMIKHQREFEMADVMNIGEDPVNAGEHRVQGVWLGLEGEKLTGESVSVIYADGPRWLEMKLERMCLDD